MRLPLAALIFAALLLSLPSPALAYIDPGILTVLYQVVYVSVFGFLAIFIFTPYRYMKGLLQKLFGNASAERDESDSADTCSRKSE
jgi:hypothetical protein